nr:hypothetical protein [Tanacetum cinerariifolium]
MALALMAKAFTLNDTTPTNKIQKSSSNRSNMKIAQLVKPRKKDAAYLRTQLQIAQKDKARIQLNSKEFYFMAAVGAYDEIEKVTANCSLQDNLQQASTLGTQSDKAPVYDSDGSAE